MGTTAGREYYFLREEHRRLKLAWSEVLAIVHLTEEEYHILRMQHADLLRLYFEGLSRMVLLGLCTLGDGVKQSDGRYDPKSPSISLPTWVSRHANEPGGMPPAVSRAVSRFITIHAPIRTLRNKVLAHTDMGYVLNDQRSGVSWATVDEAFSALDAFFRAVEKHYGEQYRADLPPLLFGGILSLFSQPIAEGH